MKKVIMLLAVVISFVLSAGTASAQCIAEPAENIDHAAVFEEQWQHKRDIPAIEEESHIEVQLKRIMV